MMYCKIFFGDIYSRADVQFNQFVEDNPDIVITHMTYQHAGQRDHSICILYDVQDESEEE